MHISMNSIDQVVRSHDCPRIGFSNSYFEWFQVNFAERPLRNERVNGESMSLLLVPYKVYVPSVTGRDEISVLDALRLIVAATPFSCKPLIYCAASLPVSRGSSEKDSKLRPPNGCRCIQTVGASSISADLAFTSSARCWPTSCRSSLFHVAAREMPQGKRAA